MHFFYKLGFNDSTKEFYYFFPFMEACSISFMPAYSISKPALGPAEQFPARRRSEFIAFRSACQRGSFTDPVLGFIASLLLYLYELQTK